MMNQDESACPSPESQGVAVTAAAAEPVMTDELTLKTLYTESGFTTPEEGSLEWVKKLNGVTYPHRDGGLPARINREGSVEWITLEGSERANGLPDYIHHDGSMRWASLRMHTNANVQASRQLHPSPNSICMVTRESDGTTVKILLSGETKRSKDGNLHGTDGRPAYISKEGVMEWILYGYPHRVDGSCFSDGERYALCGYFFESREDFDRFIAKLGGREVVMGLPFMYLKALIQQDKGSADSFTYKIEFK